MAWRAAVLFCCKREHLFVLVPQGCGGNSDWDLTTIEFRNDGWADQWFCMDRLHLV